MPITITGLEPLFKKFDNIGALRILEPPMQRAVLRGEAFMKDYPPAPAGSKYIRGRGFPGRQTSEKLGQRWTTKIDRSAHGLTGRIGNNASYAKWVQSAAYQTRFHARTGWRTDFDAVRELEPVIVADFQRAIDGALSR